MSHEDWINAGFGAVGLGVAFASGFSIMRTIRRGVMQLPHGNIHRRASPAVFWIVAAFSALIIPIGLTFAWHFAMLIEE